MAVEQRRGCGYRKVGKLYLMGTGLGRPCCRLPLVLKTCETCGRDQEFTRNLKWLKKNYLTFLLTPGKDDVEPQGPGCQGCPMNFPTELQKAGLLWVGEKFYTPETFIEEARTMGVSKAMPFLPEGLQAADWVFLAHPKVPVPSLGDLLPAIFYAFKPTHCEFLVDETTKHSPKAKRYRKQGVKLIQVPKDDPDHHSRAKGSAKGNPGESQLGLVPDDVPTY